MHAFDAASLETQVRDLVNMYRCESFGLCNVGCGAGRKTNALQVHLKAATKGDCTIVPDAEVTDLSLKGGSIEGMDSALAPGGLYQLSMTKPSSVLSGQ